METNCFKRFQDSELYAEFVQRYQDTAAAKLTHAERVRGRIDDALTHAGEPRPHRYQQSKRGSMTRDRDRPSMISRAPQPSLLPGRPQLEPSMQRQPSQELAEELILPAAAEQGDDAAMLMQRALTNGWME